MLKVRKLLAAAMGLMLSLTVAFSVSATANASDYKSVLNSLNSGVGMAVNPSAYETGTAQTALTAISSVESLEEQSGLVMANVTNALNVRAEASEDAEKLGMLYKDCGGTILERKDGWTKLQSGDLIGWASDEYLLFGEEAEALAEDVGNTIATVTSDALRIRSEASTESKVYANAAKNETFDVIEKVNDEWYSIDFDGEVAYVAAEYVLVERYIDEGETNEEIKQRKEEEALAKAQLTYNTGAFAATADEVRLLGALIQCEAGGEPYEGQLAVGAVVMNRVKSGGYPNTIAEVIYASGQFTPALNGKVEKVYNGTVKDSCLQAAQEALDGNTNVGEATHFRRAGNREGLVIGNHVFY